MIITVTFNPAIDKTAHVPSVISGSLHRLSNIRQDAAGKGINVSKTIQALGSKSICTGFLGGSSGDFIRNALEDLQIDHHFIEIEGQTRTNLKVLNADMEMSEFNEPGPEIHPEDVEHLMEAIESAADEDAIVILSGNVSPGVPKDVYRTMTRQLSASGIRVILDADGELFSQGIQAGPAVIKPNRHELAEYFGEDENMSLEKTVALARKLMNDNTRLVVVSMGADGSLFLDEKNAWQVDGLKVDFRSAAGAGDAMVAAIACSLEQNLDMEEMIRLAAAASAGACLSEGTAPADIDTVNKLKEQVIFRQI